MEIKEGTRMSEAITFRDFLKITNTDQSKGQRVMVRGRYSSSSYESPQGKKYFTQVVADLVAICLDGSPYANGGQNQQQGQPQDSENFSRFGQPTPKDEDLPF